MRDDSVFFSMSVAKQLTVAIVLNRVKAWCPSVEEIDRYANVVPECGDHGHERR